MTKQELVENAQAILELDAEIEVKASELKALKDTKKNLVDSLVNKCVTATQKDLFEDE